MNLRTAITSAASFRKSHTTRTRSTSATTEISGVRLNSCPAMTIRTPPSSSSRWPAPKAAADTRATKTTIFMIAQSIDCALSVSIQIAGQLLGGRDGIQPGTRPRDPARQLCPSGLGQHLDFRESVIEASFLQGRLGPRKDRVRITAFPRFQGSGAKLLAQQRHKSLPR